MFEIGILGIIFLAVGYWAILWTMGRRADVLHGQFVEHQPEPIAVTASVAVSQSATPQATAELLRSLLASIEQELRNAGRL